MNIYNLKISNIDNYVRISVNYTINNNEGILWYKFNKDYERYLVTESYDGFFVGLILLAMQYGEDVNIDGSISEKLYYNFSVYLMKLIKFIIPELKDVKISSKSFVKNDYQGSGVGCGFSGGIDSFKCLYDHFLDKKCPKSYVLTHLIFNNCGSHGRGYEGRKLFNQRYEIVDQIAKKVNLPFIKIDSNIQDIINLKFQKINGFMNISAVLIVQKLFSRFYYSSAASFKDCNINSANDMAQIDPMLLHLFSTESTEIISTGCQYNRIEKTKLICDNKLVQQNLNVCIDDKFNGKNCSGCWKCNRTLLTLELLNKISKFRGVFDLDKYYKQKYNYLKNYLAKNLVDNNNYDLYLLLKESSYFKSVKHLFKKNKMIYKKGDIFIKYLKLNSFKNYLIRNWK